MSSLPIRCLLLAAGLGTRLRPITDNIPKCLVEVGGEPLLADWLRKLQMIGCKQVVINTHYLSHKVEEFVSKNTFNGLDIELVYEPSLLGTAGTLLANKEFFRESTGLLIHADNAMTASLHGLIHSHQKRRALDLLTMLTFKTRSPSSCGIIEQDSTGHVIGFHEKSPDPPGNIANGALYVFNDDFLDHLESIQPRPEDFSLDVIPTLMRRINTWCTDSPFFDIGTPYSLELARNSWRNRSHG